MQCSRLPIVSSVYSHTLPYSGKRLDRCIVSADRIRQASPLCRLDTDNYFRLDEYIGMYSCKYELLQLLPNELYKVEMRHSWMSNIIRNSKSLTLKYLKNNLCSSFWFVWILEKRQDLIVFYLVAKSTLLVSLFLIPSSNFQICFEFVLVLK